MLRCIVAQLILKFDCFVIVMSRHCGLWARWAYLTIGNLSIRFRVDDAVRYILFSLYPCRREDWTGMRDCLVPAPGELWQSRYGDGGVMSYWIQLEKHAMETSPLHWTDRRTKKERDQVIGGMKKETAIESEGVMDRNVPIDNSIPFPILPLGSPIVCKAGLLSMQVILAPLLGVSGEIRSLIFTHAKQMRSR